MDATNSDGAAVGECSGAGNQLQLKKSCPVEILEKICSFMFFSEKEPSGFRPTLFCALGYTPSQPDAQEQAESGAVVVAPPVVPAPLFGG